MKNRRAFLKGSTLAVAATVVSPIIGQQKTNTSTLQEDSLYMIGPKKGYTPEIGTLLSTMEMMRHWLISSVKDLTVKELDFQLDDTSNSIGAMLLHLAATEKYYQLNTFDELSWGSWSDTIKEEWDIPMNLGENAREIIKGKPIDFYLNKLEEVRNHTKVEFAKRDDSWLQKSVIFFEDKPTNNYCKWFHVCEHESNHRGQIKFISKRFNV
ncbi:DinB family protein [Eudoraea chungangensis]|uniref:DinB family protein n=1 Tax=Eudoraea chungangensis TaxID=1481905 RepID=UPI0023EDAFE6|nr:DinB family protein [Eudoraea chungangensis]